MKATVISTGSTANSYAIELKKHGLVAVECGVHPKVFFERVGVPVAYWMSHNHSDHSRYEKVYKAMFPAIKFKTEFALEHGTMKKPCPNKGFYIDEDESRLLFATDFYDFERIAVIKKSHGIAMVECSHDYQLYRRFCESDDKLENLKALQWQNHACENQTIMLLQHFYHPNFQGQIILLHRSEAAMHTRCFSEKIIQNYFKLAHIVWA